MARYFFYVRDHELSSEDDEGQELASLADVEQEALETVVGMAREAILVDKEKRLEISVRDESGEKVLGVALSVDIIRHKS